MAFLKNLVSNVKGLFQDGKEKEARQKMLDVITNYSADGVITSEEYEELVKLQTELKIEDEDMIELKLKVLETIMDKIDEDGQITVEEIKLFNDIKSGLKVDVKVELDDNQDQEFLKKGMLQVKELFVKVKNKTVKYADIVVDKTKEVAGKVFNKDEEKKEDTTQTPPVETK